MLPVKTTICQCWDPRLLGQEAHAAPRGDAEQPCPPGQAGSSCLCRSTKACLEKCSSDIPSQNGRELHEPPMSRSCNVICYSFLWQNWQNVGMIQFLIQNLMMFWSLSTSEKTRCALQHAAVKLESCSGTMNSQSCANSSTVAQAFWGESPSDSHGET